MFRNLIISFLIVLFIGCSDKNDPISIYHSSWKDDFRCKYNSNYFIVINDTLNPVDSIDYSITLSFSESIYDLNLNSKYYYMNKTLSSVTSYSGNFEVLHDTIVFDDTLRNYLSTSPMSSSVDTFSDDSSQNNDEKYFFELSKTQFYLRHSSIQGITILPATSGIPWGKSISYKWEGYFRKND